MVGSQGVAALEAPVLTEAAVVKKVEAVEEARPILGEEVVVVAPC